MDTSAGKVHISNIIFYNNCIVTVCNQNQQKLLVNFNTSQKQLSLFSNSSPCPHKYSSVIFTEEHILNIKEGHELLSE